MKVFYITHQAANSSYGGAEIQILKTMNAINSYNGKYQISLFNHWSDRIDDADIVHIFNPRGFLNESLEIVRVAKKNNIPVITSPIFFNDLNINRKGYFRFFIDKISIEFKKFFQKQMISSFYINRNLYNIFNESDILLPNTQSEKDLILRYFGPLRSKIHVVPNGVDADFKNGSDMLFNLIYNINNYILFVGRIEPRKNIIRLIKAFSKSHLDTSLVIIGKKTDIDYYNQCRDVANEKVIFLNQLDNGSDILKSAYKCSKVFILPSYWETPGIAALEAGLAGANVVITKHGGTKEYFNNYAWYVDPYNENSIAQGLFEAYNTPKNDLLKDHIITNYLWDEVAKETIKIYDLVA